MRVSKLSQTLNPQTLLLKAMMVLEWKGWKTNITKMKNVGLKHKAKELQKHDHCQLWMLYVVSPFSFPLNARFKLWEVYNFIINATLLAVGTGSFIFLSKVKGIKEDKKFQPFSPLHCLIQKERDNENDQNLNANFNIYHHWYTINKVSRFLLNTLLSFYSLGQVQL